MTPHRRTWPLPPGEFGWRDASGEVQYPRLEAWGGGTCACGNAIYVDLDAGVWKCCCGREYRVVAHFEVRGDGRAIDTSEGG